MAAKALEERSFPDVTRPGFGLTVPNDVDTGRPHQIAEMDMGEWNELDIKDEHAKA